MRSSMSTKKIRSSSSATSAKTISEMLYFANNPEYTQPEIFLSETQIRQPKNETAEQSIPNETKTRQLKNETLEHAPHHQDPSGINSARRKPSFFVQVQRKLPFSHRSSHTSSHAAEAAHGRRRRRVTLIVISCLVVIATVLSVVLTMPSQPSSDFVSPPPPPRFVAQSGLFGLSYILGEPPTDIQEAFEESFEKASLFWSGVINNDLEKIDMDNRTDVDENSFCGDSTLLENWFKLPKIIEGIQVGVRIMSIDGTRGTLAQTTPCAFEPMNRNTSGVSVRSRGGVILFDAADIRVLLADGNLDSVMRHELAHVFGFGTLWRFFGLSTGRGTQDPRYEGSSGVAGFKHLLSEAGDNETASNPDLTVPIENQGGLGTASLHWRISAFENELMTGFLKTGEAPVSIMTVKSLRDLGFSVNEKAAEEYLLPVDYSGVVRAARMKAGAEGEAIDLSGDVLELDIGRIWAERKARKKKRRLRALSDLNDFID